MFKKSTKIIIILIYVIGILFCFNIYADQKSYVINKECLTDPSLQIVEITITDKETIVYFEYLDVLKDNDIGGIYPPGHDMAFYIIDVHKAKKYHLLDVEGIAIRPNVNTIKRGKRYRFQIIFEKIAMKRFHIIEGSAEFAHETAWYFTNLSLETIKKKHRLNRKRRKKKS